jgi:large subunit ribosomal protein L25
MNQFELLAEVRAATGSRPSRRLRRNGMVPAVLYGAGKEVVALMVKHSELLKQLENQAFYSHILTVRMEGLMEQAVLKELQRDPVSSQVIHLDLQRVMATEKIYMHVPLRFINEDKCPGKKAGGVISHLMIEVEVSCLPRDLPEFIEVDMSNVELGHTVQISGLVLPEGVELVALTGGREQDQPVVNVHPPHGMEEEVTTPEGTGPGT